MRRKRVIMAKMSRLEEADRDFDHAFWEKIGPAGILAAMWEMIYEYHRLRGDYVRPPRLRRSVEVFKRR
jgi:hypothetical protein